MTPTPTPTPTAPSGDDGDGVSPQDGDCDDGDAEVYPGALAPLAYRWVGPEVGERSVSAMPPCEPLGLTAPFLGD